MKDALGHGSNDRGGPKKLAKPIPGHPYHRMDDMQLRYIQKDAQEAGRNAQEMGDQRGVNKYADQVNDAATVLGYRKRGGAQDLGGQAASGLASGPKSAPIPTHDSMRGVGPNSDLAGSREYDSFGRPRDALGKSEYDEGSRDMALRSRNGQIGSGMKFRG